PAAGRRRSQSAPYGPQPCRPLRRSGGVSGESRCGGSPGDVSWRVCCQREHRGDPMTDAFPARERPDVHSRRVPASGAGIRPATGADDAGSRPGPHLAALEPTAPPPAAAELAAPEPTAPPVTSQPREPAPTAPPVTSELWEPEPTAPLPAARTRDPFLDNARGILVALVVIGHTLESFEVTTETAGGALYTWIYSFHMAAFVAISGYLSRSY